MKRFFHGMIWSSLAVFLFSCTFSAEAGAEKYAFLDVARVFDEYEKTKANDENLQKLGESKEGERNVIVEDIRRMKDELELLSDDAKKEKQEAINTRVRELQEFDAAARRELGEKRREAVQEIFNDIDKVVQEFGKKQGYDFILNDKALLYKNDKMDISEEILKQLNQNYKGKK